MAATFLLKILAHKNYTAVWGVVLGIELRPLHVLGKSTTELNPPPLQLFNSISLT